MRIEGERAAADQSAAAEGRRRAQDALEATQPPVAARESELASARIEHEWRARWSGRASTSSRGSRRD